MNNSNKKQLNKTWKKIRPYLSFLISVVIVYFVAKFSIQYLVSNYINPVDVNDPTPIEIVIPESSSASRIAQILYNARGQDEKGLISNTAVFKVYVDFIGKASNLRSGTYILSRNMTLKQIVDTICDGNSQQTSIRYTIPEGYTVEDIAKTLETSGLLSTKESFLKDCSDISLQQSFSFISLLTDEQRNAREYIVEGYLFPDTYEAYPGTGEQELILKQLNRFNQVFSESMIQRAEEIGLTVDETIILASLIEREARAEGDFAKVSAVFHNRLKESMALQSCASLCYALKVQKYVFTDSELKTDSPYNTYKKKGLPVGPICNPGEKAILAALYPNQEYIDEGYLYFCNGNIKLSSELVFAKTYEEHQANVDMYKQYWN